MYPESIEEVISPPILKEADGTESKFHGAGREDIDVKMLGTGRPFVLEIKEPHKRNLNLKDLKKIINQDNTGKVEISDLKFTDKSRRRLIKTSSTDTYKVYCAKVSLDKEITPKDMDLIKSMEKIDQRTPKRVAHRRADLIRKRRIRDIEIKVLADGCLALIIECQGGLYIKELISGDDNRTNPSISSILNTEARCVQLDVLDVHIN
jgi:tRNA pseudouridine synthase 10